MIAAPDAVVLVATAATDVDRARPAERARRGGRLRTARRTGRDQPSRGAARRRAPRTSCSRSPRSRGAHRSPSSTTTSRRPPGGCTRTSTSSSTTSPRATRTRSSAQATRVPGACTCWGRTHADRTGPAGASSPSSPTAATTCTRRGAPRPSRRPRPTHPTRDATDADFPDPDYVVYVRDDAILPSRFLDDLIATQGHLDVDRLQPTHISGPASGPPITERHRGVIAREVDGPTPLPVLVGARRGRPRWPGGASRPRERRDFARRYIATDRRHRCLLDRAHGVGARHRRFDRALRPARARRASAHQCPDRDVRAPRPAARVAPRVREADARTDPTTRSSSSTTGPATARSTRCSTSSPSSSSSPGSASNTPAAARRRTWRCSSPARPSCCSSTTTTGRARLPRATRPRPRRAPRARASRSSATPTGRPSSS